MPYLHFDNTAVGADAILLSVRKVGGVWFFPFIPDFGDLSELVRAIRLHEAHLADPKAVVTIIEPNTQLWTTVDDEKVIMTREDPTGTHTKVELDEMRLHAGAGHHGGGTTDHHGEPHAMCLCNGVFKKCGPGEGPAECCA